MKKWLIFTWVFLVTVDRTEAQISLDDRETFSFDGNVFLFREPGKPLTLTELWSHYIRNDFRSFSTPTNSVNLGFVTHIYWLAIPVKNVLNKDRFLEVGVSNSGIFRLEHYLLSSGGQVLQHFITGSNYDFNSRPIVNRHYFFPLNLEAGGGAVIFFRVDMRGNGLDVPLELGRKEDIDSQEHKAALFYSFFSGLLVFVVLLSLITYIWTKDRVYLFYSFYVMSCCLFFLGDGNFDFEWLYPHLPLLATISPTIYAGFFCFFMLLFMNEFLQLKSKQKTLYRLIRIWLVMLGILVILLPQAYFYSSHVPLRIFTFGYTFVAIVGAWVIQAVCIVRRILDKYKPAYLYGVALILVFVSSVIYVLHVLGLIGDLIPTFIYIPLGFAIEINILSFALIYSYDYFKNQHQRLSLSLADQKLDFTEQLLKVQEAERKRIAEDLHDELGGNLAAIKMNFQRLEFEDQELKNNIVQLIDKASENGRAIAHDLMPPEFAKTTLTDLLSTFYKRLNRDGRIEFHFYISGQDGHFNKKEDLTIYRIIMELTSNIIKHSQASEATIQLVYYDDYLELMAEDNGKGFSGENSGGIGLTNIESRVNYLRGSINIDTSAYGSTTMIKILYTGK